VSEGQLAFGDPDPWWLDGALRAIREMAATGREFGADDLRVTYGLSEPDHPAAWGALFRIACRKGWIVPVGARPSRTSSRQGSLIRTWRGISPMT
jgi:hypothetical protein